jgi:RimJ/RimL family protein N-acetyltransferase
MNLVLGHDKTVADWAGEKFGVTIHPGYIAWGVIDGEGTLTGAIVLHNFMRRGNMEMAMVGAVVRRDILRRLARYVFGQLGCTRCTARTARSNVLVRKMLPRAGFQFEGVNKRWYGPDREHDALVFALFPEQAKRWMA